MKKKRLLASMAATAVAMSSLAAMNFVANAEEATETPTEIATEAPTQVVTEVPTQGTTEVPTETPTEDPTTPMKIAIVDGWVGLGTWNGIGDFTGTVNLSYFDEYFGEFKSLTNLSLREGEVDSAYYSVVQTDEDITITLSEEYMNHLADIAKSNNIDVDYYFEMDFEYVLLSAAFMVNVIGIQPDAVEPIVTTPKTNTGSPKTGTSGIGFVFGGLSVAGITAVVTRKRK